VVRCLKLNHPIIMAHDVTGLIAKHTFLEAFSRDHSVSWPVALYGDLAILPMRDIDLAPFQPVPKRCISDGDEFRYLSEPLLEELQRFSLHRGPLLYFETEYDAGLGGQGAAVFKDGELIFGPHWAGIGPINQALRLLGVRVEARNLDEFQTVGLHLHRTEDGWLKRQ
jgi:hypothetical protein